MRIYNSVNAPAGNPNTYTATSLLEAQESIPAVGTAVGYTFLTGAGAPNVIGSANVAIRVSDNGNLAVEHANLSRRQPKHFFANPTLLDDWNKLLAKVGSRIQLIPDGTSTIQFTMPGGVQKTLVLVRAANVSEGSFGSSMTIAQPCNQTVNVVVGSATVPKLGRTVTLPGGQFDEYLVDMLTGNRSIPAGGITAHNIDAVSGRLAMEYGGALYRITTRHATAGDQALAQELQNLKLNQYAQPEVGEGMYTKGFGEIQAGPGGAQSVQDYTNNRIVNDPANINNRLWQYHWAGVVAKDGADYITLENYARGTEGGGGDQANDPRFYFQMYGATPNHSWHEQWTAIGGGGREFANAISMVVKPNPPAGLRYFCGADGVLAANVNGIKNAHNEITNATTYPQLHRALLKGLNYASVHLYASSMQDTYANRARWQAWIQALVNPPVAMPHLNLETESLRVYVHQLMGRVNRI